LGREAAARSHLRERWMGEFGGDPEPRTEPVACSRLQRLLFCLRNLGVQSWLIAIGSIAYDIDPACLYVATVAASNAHFCNKPTIAIAR
jgi:hypothetical protein